MVSGERIVFCETCGKHVILRRKPFEHKYHELLCILIITGVGFLMYLILKYSKKKDRCPNCETKFDIGNIKKVTRESPEYKQYLEEKLI